MDNSPIIVILNIWDIWRYNWLATIIRKTLTDREEETTEQDTFLQCLFEKILFKSILPQEEDFD